MRLLAFTDGASRNNPGEAGIGIVIKNESGQRVAEIHKYLGITTNNVAEYTALIQCLEYLAEHEKKLNCTSLVVHTDSELMARQVTGQYKVKDEHLKQLHATVKNLLNSADFEFTIKHVPRSLNKEADELANQAIDSKI